MMYQSKSGLAGKISSLVLLPALAIGMAAVSIPSVASVITDASEAPLVELTGKISKNSDNPQTADMLSAPDTDAAAVTEAEERSDSRTVADTEIS